MVRKIIVDYKLLYLIPLLLFFALVYKFYLSQATWNFFEYNQGRFYNWLAQGFLEGKLGVASYVVEHNPGGFGDGIFLNGNIYLPWGPFPAILHLISIILTGKGIFSSTLTYWFSLLNLTVLWFLLIRFSQLFLKRISVPVILALFFSYAVGPLMFNIGRGYVYEEAIVVASTLFLLSILTLTFIQQVSTKKQILLILLSGLFFGLAIISRFNYIMYGPLLVFYFAIFSDFKLSKTHLFLFARNLLLFLIPILLFFSLQLAYNQARFGSPTETGNKYQKVGNKDVNPRLNQLLSASYITYNLENYLLAPVFLSPSGSLYYSDFPNSIGPFPKLVPTEYTSSIFLSYPILFAYFISFLLILIKTGFKLKKFIILSQIGLFFFLIFGLCIFLGNGLRYIQDFLPIFYLISLLPLSLIFFKLTKPFKVAFCILLLLLTFYAFGISVKKNCYAWIGKYSNNQECKKLYRPVEEFIHLS